MSRYTVTCDRISFANAMTPDGQDILTTTDVGTVQKSLLLWPQMRDGVELYVRTCLVCQLDNMKN